MSSFKKTVTEGYKTYATFGWSDYSKGKAPYQQAAESVVPPPPEIPALPVPEASSKPMPLADDAAVKAAQRRATEAQQRRRGRRSTILSDQGDLVPLGE